MSQYMMNPVKRVRRRYAVEFAISMLAYLGVMAIRNRLLHGPLRHADKSWQIVIALLPLLPTCFVFTALVRLLRGTDELCRRVCVDSLALAGGATALIAITWGLIEGDFLPHLSAWWTYATFMVSWMVAAFFVRRRYQ
jgi:hypothetical protein